MRFPHFSFAFAVLAACSSFEAPADVADGGSAGDGGEGEPDGASAQYRRAVLADEPIAYWRMGNVQSGTVVPDETKNGNSLLLSGTDFAVDAAGILPDDRAVRFGGASKGSPTTSTPFLFDGNAPFTLECWARRELDDAGGPGETFQHLISFVEGYSTAPGGSTENGYILFLRTDSQPSAQGSYGAIDGGPVNVSGPLVMPDTWAHYAFVMNGTETILYVNAAEQAKAKVRGVITSRSVQLTLAKASNDARFFRGSLDEVAIYGKALDAPRILAHYQAGRP